MSMRAMLLALVGSSEAYSLIAVPRASTRTVSPQMQMFGRDSYQPNFGDNNYERREMLNSAAGSAAPGEGPIGSDSNTYNSYFGDNTPARREALSTAPEMSGSVVPTAGTPAQGAVAYPSYGAYEANFGDNNLARVAALNNRA